ncbi:MBL fold metallo-hydrolase [Rhizobium lentis]|uniref:Glyoxylase-like metal-dependent hydrolase (Beta-lactamase superfamily II) n=1 Tax=Rhizobium lentis TaxID=1138194 RepID=A0A7W8XIX2_9HYPH|nr:MBL fold metallo-hydrolase [Rhizobium lentis]MBB5553324.1 glyoxylase-like metal-dependent hydrolase (beta-lactamase superfamily II) [Rhizobium lentis]MBB5563644.1 glyoxylase-like metal-dependent hydrolase (beta-lactamase superfamily II) [Rhizobium lentis]MBB5570251.1 glyoxylase-like metal-dependent hydrolase (beta-lactamase superfamily II) [Rhizobium lentis]
MLNDQAHQTKVPYFYPFKFGTGEITVLSDGPLELGDPRENFLGVDAATVTDMLDRNFLSSSSVTLEQNIPLVKINGKTILFDTGMGTSKIFGPTTGRLLKSMQEAGIDPLEVDAVVLSHAHIDHTGGLCDQDGKLNFPNAEIFISESDFDDWTDGGKLDAGFKAQVENARRNLLPHRDRIAHFVDGQEFLPGVQAVHAPGHTLGHFCFLMQSDNDRLCFLGDLTHHHILLMERPWMEFKYDTDPKLSARSRTRVLDMLATDRIPVMSYHFAWPGLGNVAREREGFRYVPAAMQMLSR